MNRIYIVKWGLSEEGQCALDYIENYLIEDRVFIDYESATRYLLDYSTRYTNNCNLIWLEVYDIENKNINGSMKHLGTYYYHIYGKNEIGTKFYREDNISQFDLNDGKPTYFGVDSFEISHYIPEEYERIYKKIKMELKLAK